MLTWDHLQPRVMNVDCLLNECDERSYKALDEMSAILLGAIRAQGAKAMHSGRSSSTRSATPS